MWPQLSNGPQAWAYRAFLVHPFSRILVKAAHPAPFFSNLPAPTLRGQLLSWPCSSWRKREASKPEPSCGPTMICDLACTLPSPTKGQVSQPHGENPNPTPLTPGPHSCPSVSSGTFCTQSFSITHLDKKSHFFACSPLWLPPSLFLCTENLASVAYSQCLKPLSLPQPTPLFSLLFHRHLTFKLTCGP